MKLLVACLGTIVVVALVFGEMDDCQTYPVGPESMLDDIHRKVCDDAVRQYEIAKRNGSPIDTCVHAGLVAAAFLQAQDVASYAAWKKTETADCTKAGVPR